MIDLSIEIITSLVSTLLHVDKWRDLICCPQASTQIHAYPKRFYSHHFFFISSSLSYDRRRDTVIYECLKFTKRHNKKKTIHMSGLAACAVHWIQGSVNIYSRKFLHQLSCSRGLSTCTPSLFHLQLVYLCGARRASETAPTARYSQLKKFSNKLYF